MRPHGGPGDRLPGFHGSHRRRAHHVHPLRPDVHAEVVVGRAAVHAAVGDAHAAEVQREAAAGGVASTSVVGDGGGNRTLRVAR